MPTSTRGAEDFRKFRYVVMEVAAKKKRCANLQYNEKELLVDLITKHRSVVDCKATDTVSVKMKQTNPLLQQHTVIVSGPGRELEPSSRAAAKMMLQLRLLLLLKAISCITELLQMRCVEHKCKLEVVELKRQYYTTKLQKLLEE